jgi:hypothetical protein
MKQACPAVVCVFILVRLEENLMKPRVSGSVLGAIAAAAMLLPLAAAPAAAQMPGGSYRQSCRDVQVRGDRLTAICRTRDGGWNQTSIGSIGQCAGGIANSDGRLVCGTRGGGFNTGSESGRNRRDEGRQADRDRRDDDRRGDRDWREHDWRRDRDWNGYGNSYGYDGPGRDPGGR